METRTIGSFIATLRKAKGLTQKDLAEKLSVSDKAVSRWERDECAPDLTLIPVIADIFGVTTDELLRGQRNNPENPKPEQPTEKSKKQLNRILKENKTRLLTNSLIALGIGFAGLIAAMICNLAFLRAYLGFFVGCGFYLMAVVMETIFGVQAFSSVSSEDFEEEAITSHRKELKGILKCAALGLALLFVVTLPLVIHVWDAYMGLTAGSWLGLALIYCAVAAGLFFLGQWVYRGIQLGRNKEDDSPKTEKARKLHRLQTKVMGFTALALLITLILQSGFNDYCYSKMPFVSGETFQNIDEFYAWAMADLEDGYSQDDYIYWEQDESYVEYFDENGDSISVEELKAQAENGSDFSRINAIISISPRNISRTDFSDNGSYFPLTVYTNEDWLANSNTLDDINICFIFLCIGEIVAGIVIYNKKRKSL